MLRSEEYAGERVKEGGSKEERRRMLGIMEGACICSSNGRTRLLLLLLLLVNALGAWTLE